MNPALRFALCAFGLLLTACTTPTSNRAPLAVAAPAAPEAPPARTGQRTLRCVTAHERTANDRTASGRTVPATRDVLVAAPEPNVARPTRAALDSFVEEVEPAPAPRAAHPSPARYEVDYGGYVQQMQRQPAPRDWFPVNTLIGAGVGAIIGNQNGSSGQGATIGSGIGLLFDLGRWTR